MSSPVVFPNGQTFTTTGLTLNALQRAFQALVANIFSLDISTEDALGFSQVRVDFPPDGQPGFTQADDVIFVRCSTSGESWGDIFDTAGGWTPGGYGEGSYGGNDYGELYPDTTVEHTQYQRVWEVRFEVYGPAACERAAILRSALFMDWVGDALSANNLTLVTEVPRPQRVPELFSGHWWNHFDVTARFNEGVSEELTQPAGASVEFIVRTPTATLADVLITPPASGG